MSRTRPSISAPAAPRTLDAVLKAVTPRRTLVISFSPDKAAAGAAVDLGLMPDFKVRYLIQMEQFNRAGLVPSPGLLKLALNSAPANPATLQPPGVPPAAGETAWVEPSRERKGGQR